MKKAYISAILASSLFFQMLTSNAQDAASSSKTGFTEATKALSNKAIGDFFPMYDAQVNQVLRMSAKGGDLVGSINALVALGVYMGNEIDAEEESVLIKGSKTDVVLYNQIAKAIVSQFKKPNQTSVQEAALIIDQIDKGNGAEMLKGIQTLSSAQYRLRTGHDLAINKEKLELWTSVGKLEANRFMELYSSLQSLGMSKELNETTAKGLLKLVDENSNPDILKAIESLKMAQWRCEGELDAREVNIIANVVHTKFTEESGLTPHTVASAPGRPTEMLSEKRAMAE